MPINDVLTILLAFIGVGVTSYLVWKNIKKKPAVCFIGQDCEVVLQSKYNKTLGVKNETMGILYYLAIPIFVVVPYVFPQLLTLVLIVHLISTVLAFLFSLILTYIQIFVLKSYCSWCLLSAFVNVSLLIAILVKIRVPIGYVLGVYDIS